MTWRKTPADRARDAQVYGPAYRRARRAALERAGWRCEIRIEGICLGAATEADHADQTANDPDHESLRAACRPCHLHVTARQGGGRRAPADPECTPRTKW